MKRGASGLSLVCAVDKPEGLTSHDVVARARRIFAEKRVGHNGTLDPLATGVLVVCVGSATRLNPYLTDHDKRYRVRVDFGASTDTDDAQGTVTRTAPIPAELADEGVARRFLEGIIGPQRQLPPVYSAVKVGGRKACDEARKGRVITVEPRDIEVYEATLVAIGEGGLPGSLSWTVDFHVSKGTYIRSLARDMGRSLGCPAHVGALRRLAAGPVPLSDCASLDALADLGPQAALDPVRLLGLRFAYVGDAEESLVANGASLDARALSLCERIRRSAAQELCACTSGVMDSPEPPQPGELVSVVAGNKLAAIYGFDQASSRFKARCVFQGGIIRGCDL